MRILAFTDIHGAFAEVEKAIAAAAEFDVIVLGGDLTTYGTPAEVRNWLNGFPSRGKPMLVVAGNMDPPEVEEEIVRLGYSISGRGVMIGSVGFFGVSAAPLSPLHTPNEITEEEIEARAVAGMKDLTGATRTIFVPHAPPSDTTLDRTFSGLHVGSISVRRFIERHQPDVTICGHIHESRGIDTLGTSRVVNCGSAAKGKYAVITLGEDVEVELRG